MFRRICSIVLLIVAAIAVFATAALAQPIDIPLIPCAGAEQVGLTCACTANTTLIGAGENQAH